MSKKEIKYLQNMGPDTYKIKNEMFVRKHKELIMPFKEFEQSGIPLEDFIDGVCLTLRHIDTSSANKIRLANIIGPKTGKYITQHLSDIETVI